LDKFLWYGKRAGLLYHSYTYAGPMCLYFLIKTFLVSVWAYMCNHRELLLCDQLLEEFQSIWPIGHILTSCLPPFHLPLSLSRNFVCNAKIYIVLLLLNLLTCYGNRKMQEESVDVRETRNAEHYGALIHHLSLIRNKRCLMAYV